MKKLIIIFVPIIFSFYIILDVYEVANPPFSSDSRKIGDYEVQISTNPTVPSVDKDTTILFRVLDKNGQEVEKFRMGIEIYYNDKLVNTFPPLDHNGGRWETDYTFHESGNHVFMVDLYGIEGNGVVTTYSLNISTLNLYGGIFFAVVIAGLAGGAGILIAILIFKKFKK